jgi:hypothetical protein
VSQPNSPVVASALVIEQRIFLIRGRKVMLDRDLAVLYEVETRALNQAVRRHIDRFPSDFMFQLTTEEIEDWKSQIVISNRERMGVRKPPLAFTEYGVAMLSSVLTSERAVQVNIAIMRAFGRLRSMLLTQVELTRRLEDLEARYDQQFTVVFDAIRELMAPEPDELARRIGFGADTETSSCGAVTSAPAT